MIKWTKKDVIEEINKALNSKPNLFERLRNIAGTRKTQPPIVRR